MGSKCAFVFCPASTSPVLEPLAILFLPAFFFFFLHLAAWESLFEILQFAPKKKRRAKKISPGETIVWKVSWSFPKINF